MYLDFFTLAALVDELGALLPRGRIQDVLDVDATALGLEIYARRRRHWLYLSADPGQPRLYLSPERLRRGPDKATPLCLLLRRYVEGGRLERISQPAWERVVVLHVAGPEGDVQLIVEPMERRSNVLLVRDGVILDCLRRVHPGENRVRSSLPAHPYQPPPPQRGKHNPLKLTSDDLGRLQAEDSSRNLSTRRFLSARLLGVSPLLAREAVHRSSAPADQRASDVRPEDLWQALRSVLEPLAAGQWQPGLAGDDDFPRAFSVYPLHCEPDWRPVASVNVALVTWYLARTGPDSYRAAKKPVAAALEEARLRLEARAKSLQRSLTDDDERERLRQSGELLLAYQYTLASDQRELRAQYEPDGPELVIQLDGKHSPLENAQRYFARYEKAKRALQDVPRLLRRTKAQLRSLDQLSCDLELAASRPDIEDVQAALQSMGLWRGGRRARTTGQKSSALRLETSDGFVIRVGRNSRQNEEVTFERASGADLWLHARGVPGAHVIVRNDGRPIPDEVLEQAAGLAAWFSPQRQERSVAVDVTARRHVRRIQGAGPGLVSYRNERTLRVRPRSPEAALDH
ncbi:MAG: NFACT RNA binding domain-containing protein [Anaerolineaceae bacterium]|nr:NFACT RNA binding domain-containing protein [Anaerolineaceae bacterium]